MKKQIIYILISVFAIGLFAVDRTPIRKIESSQVAAGDTVTTTLQGDSVSYTTDKAIFSFNKDIFVNGVFIPNIEYVRSEISDSLGNVDLTNYFTKSETRTEISDSLENFYTKTEVLNLPRLETLTTNDTLHFDVAYTGNRRIFYSAAEGDFGYSKLGFAKNIYIDHFAGRDLIAETLYFVQYAYTYGGVYKRLNTVGTWSAWTATTDLSNYVDKSSAQTITGVKTFDNGLKTNSIQNEAADASITLGTATNISYNSPYQASTALSIGAANMYINDRANQLAFEVTNPTRSIYYSNGNKGFGLASDSLTLWNKTSNKAALSLLNGFNIFRYPNGRAGIILTDPTFGLYGRTGKIWMEHQAEVQTSIKYANATSTEAINIGANTISIKDLNGGDRIYIDNSSTSIGGGDDLFLYGDLTTKAVSLYANYAVEVLHADNTALSLYSPVDGFVGLQVRDSILFSKPTFSTLSHTAQTFKVDTLQDRSLAKGEIGWNTTWGGLAVGVGGGVNVPLSPTYAYGGIHVADASTAQSIPTGMTYTKITAFTNVEPSYNVTSEADSMIVLVSGLYEIQGSFSMASGTNNVNVLGAAFKNDTELENIHFERKIGIIGDVGSCSFSGKVYLTAGDRVSFRMRTDDAGAVDITIHYANLGINLLREY